MAKLTQFSIPAKQEDFPPDSEQYKQLCIDWSRNVDGFTQQSITGNPWAGTNQQDQTSYYNPLHTNIPAGDAAVQVSWVAFPGRFDQYLGDEAYPSNPYNYSQQQLWELADTGSIGGKSFPNIPTDLCGGPNGQVNWNSPLHPYGPYGPRGWLDEYCEWSVTRNAAGKIIRVDFACENPEYWYTLWRISPEKVAAIYQSTLNYGAPQERQIKVTVEDLQLVDPKTKKPVIDPSTGRPAYNPLNKWNSGTVATRTGTARDSGGAMHLTSTPNTLQTEIGLAGSATVLRTMGNADPQALICCSQYGQNYRHSDPHIGQSVNAIVSGTPSTYAKVSLADPVGLYIQMPDFSGYQLPNGFKLPAGAQPSDCWHVVRGATQLIDPVTKVPYPSISGDEPGNFILHAVFQLPQAWVDANPSMTVQDILINGQNIAWAAQIAETFNMALYARAVTTSAAATPQPCVGTPAAPLAQPLQMMYKVLWDAYYNTPVPNPVGFAMNLASNTVIIPPAVPQGARNVQMALSCVLGSVNPNALPTVTFSPSHGIKAHCTNIAYVNYAVPGNSYPSQSQLLTLVLDIAPDTPLGLKGVRITNSGQRPGQAAPAFLNIVEPTNAWETSEGYTA